MSNIWSYEGRRVVITGGGGAGMGAAIVTELTDLGAEIHVIDLKEPPVPVASHQVVDLRDPDATSNAIASIPGDIHALFNCAGLPGPPFSDVDTVLVNFAASRHVTELCAPRMPIGSAVVSISSSAGASYALNADKWKPLLLTKSFDDARAWCEQNPQAIASGYAPSKEILILWTLYAAHDYSERGIRLNCTSPGPTDTPMMPAFEDFAGAPLIDLFARGLGRRSTPEEQAYVCIFLNSRAASYINGENVATDGGTMTAVTAGRINLDF